MRITAFSKIDGNWESLGSAGLSNGNINDSILGKDYIYNNINGTIIQCCSVSITADGSSEEIKQEITLKRAFPNMIVSTACSCDSTKYNYGNLNVVAIPTGKDKVKIAIRHLDAGTSLEGSFTVYLSCFGM